MRGEALWRARLEAMQSAQVCDLQLICVLGSWWRLGQGRKHNAWYTHGLQDVLQANNARLAESLRAGQQEFERLHVPLHSNAY